jgi:DNA-binding transcriptional ArsR family regulator
VPSAEREQAVFAALADPTRRRVIEELRRRETVTATELARAFPVTRQAMAKHLAALDAAGLVHAERRGRETRYRFEPAAFGDALAWMAVAGAAWDERLERLRAAADRRRGVTP